MDWFHFFLFFTLILNNISGHYNVRYKNYNHLSGEGNSFLQYEDEYDDVLDYNPTYLGLTYYR